MAFPTSPHRFNSSFSSSFSAASGASSCGSGDPSPPPSHLPTTTAAVGCAPSIRVGGSEGEHRLEKLEFALAVALSRKDTARVQNLRDQIDALGGNAEEPGT